MGNDDLHELTWASNTFLIWGGDRTETIPNESDHKRGYHIASAMLTCSCELGKKDSGKKEGISFPGIVEGNYQ